LRSERQSKNLTDSSHHFRFFFVYYCGILPGTAVHRKDHTGGQHVHRTIAVA
jgi:hypothetical protein